jgi:hypothetical protein
MSIITSLLIVIRKFYGIRAERFRRRWSSGGDIRIVMPKIDRVITTVEEGNYARIENHKEILTHECGGDDAPALLVPLLLDTYRDHLCRSSSRSLREKETVFSRKEKWSDRSPVQLLSA